MKKNNAIFFAALTVLSFSNMTFASMGNLATTFGLLPTDMATAQSYSLFNGQVSASYYNPAALAQDNKGSLTMGLLQATPSLKVKTTGGNNPPVRSGSVLESEQTEALILGMKANLTSLSKFKTPLYFGLIGGIEKYGQEMLAFNSSTSREGQFMQYGQKPLFLAGSVAAGIYDGVDIGFGLRLTLHANATMKLETDLAGNTTEEQMNVSAKPEFVPLFGMNIDLNTLVCAQATECLWKDLDLAMSYRSESNTKTKVDATAVIPGTVSNPGLPLVVSALDAYQPMILSFGAKYQLNTRWDLAVTFEHQNWASLTNKLQSDTINDQANLVFSNTSISRIGSRYQYNKALNLSAGLSYEESPLKSTESQDVNLFDNDRMVASFGFTQVYENTPILAFPLRIDGAYQYHHLKQRDFTLSSLNESQYETVTTSGNAHVLSLSFAMMF